MPIEYVYIGSLWAVGLLLMVVAWKASRAIYLLEDIQDSLGDHRDLTEEGLDGRTEPDVQAPATEGTADDTASDHT